jgi:hypothetical protein
VDPVISDGYWLVLEPLPLGRHVLHTGGRFRGVPFLKPHEIVANITVTADQAFQELLQMLENATVAKRNVQPLLGEAKVAQLMVDRGKFGQAAHHLRVFEQQIDRHLSAREPALATALHHRAQEIILALEAVSR